MPRSKEEMFKDLLKQQITIGKLSTIIKKGIRRATAETFSSIDILRNMEKEFQPIILTLTRYSEFWKKEK